MGEEKQGKRRKKDKKSSQSHHTEHEEFSAHEAWSRGPPSGSSHEQRKPPGQGSRSRDQPSESSYEQRKPPGQGSRSRDQPSGSSHEERRPGPQGAWSRGPPSGRSQYSERDVASTSSQESPSSHSQVEEKQGKRRKKEKKPSQERGEQEEVTMREAWSKDSPPPGTSQQAMQGAWSRGPSQVYQGGQGPPQRPESSQSKQKEPSKPPSDQPSTSRKKDTFFQFAERIYASNRSGRQIAVSTNNFPLIIQNPKIIVYHYDVTIDPEKPKSAIRPVWKKFLSTCFPGRVAAFDGKNAFSKGPLINQTNYKSQISIVLEGKEKSYEVTIKEVRQVSLSCFVNYRERMARDPSMKVLPEAEISVLEIIIKDWACDNYLRVGRSFFSPTPSRSPHVTLSDRLALRHGFFQSVALGYKPYLNFDISHKGFYVERPLLDILESFKHPRTNVLNTDSINHFLRAVKVEYKLPNDSTSRIFSVNKIVDNAHCQKFTREDNSQISVEKYFETEKHIRLRRPEVPLLWVGSRQKSIYLPMEFCKIAPNQSYKGLLDPFEQREMVKKTTTNAKVRKDKIYDNFDRLNFDEHPLMKEFELKVSKEMEKVTGRVLDPPRLRTSERIQVKMGTWRISDFLEPVKLRKWCILNLDRRVRRDNILTLQNMIKNKGRELKMEILEPIKSYIESDSSYAGLKKVFSQLRDMEMVLVIITEDKGVYSRVKVITETQEGILTQCVKGRTALQDSKFMSSTVQNILLKINAKLGGKNHCLDRNSVPKCLEGYVMVIGADVTHSSPGLRIPSVAAVTVSCDPAAFQYSSSIKVQPKGEVIRDLQEIITHHLKRFYEIRKKYPEKIIFFRDGVSEGELPTVFKEELTAVNKACASLCKPKITFVIVQKRHHTRFFPTRQQDEEGKNFNVPVGTCVDTDIVHPRDLDFYLVSHSSLGTARPTRYRVIHDDSKLTDEEIETLSYYLCHLFSRCNRSVSYPSPTYNAHLAAARVRAYLEGLNLNEDEDVETIQRKVPDRISKSFPMFFV